MIVCSLSVTLSGAACATPWNAQTAEMTPAARGTRIREKAPIAIYIAFE
jgi:hypothetical protein